MLSQPTPNKAAIKIHPMQGLSMQEQELLNKGEPVTDLVFEAKDLSPTETTPDPGALQAQILSVQAEVNLLRMEFQNKFEALVSILQLTDIGI